MKFFKKSKNINIPLVRKDISGKITPTGQWIECVEGDETYQKLIKAYGLPLPKTIEVEPLKPSSNV